MNINEQIRKKLNLSENCEVEYKSAAGGFPKTEFWKTFSAFANTNGGTIVVGVKEKNHKFTPDGLTAEQIEKYRKQLVKRVAVVLTSSPRDGRITVGLFLRFWRNPIQTGLRLLCWWTQVDYKVDCPPLKVDGQVDYLP